MRFTCYASDSDSEECYDTATSTHPRTTDNQVASVNGSSATIPDECSGNDTSDDSDSDDDDASVSDNESVISSTSTLCSLAAEANAETVSPAANAETEAQTKQEPQRAPLLLGAPEPASADGESCKVVVLYNRSHSHDHPDIQPGRKEVEAFNSEAEAGHGTNPENALQVVLHSRASKLAGLEQARHSQCSSDFPEGAEESVQLVSYAKSSASAQAGDDPPSPTFHSASNSEAPLSSHQIALHNPPARTILHPHRDRPSQEKSSQEGRMSMRWEHDTFVLQYTSRSGATVEVEVDGLSTMPNAEPLNLSSSDEEKHNDFVVGTSNNVLAPVQEDYKGEQAPVPEAKAETKVEAEPAVHNTESASETEHFVEEGENTRPEQAVPIQAPPLSEYSHGQEYGHGFEAVPYPYAYPHSYSHPSIYPFSAPERQPEPPLELRAGARWRKRKPQKDKYKLARGARREAYTHRRDLKKFLTKDKKTRKALREAVEASRAEWWQTLEREQVQACSFNTADVFPQEDIVPMDVDEDYHTGDIKEGEMYAVLSLRHGLVRKARAHDEDDYNGHKSLPHPRTSVNFACTKWRPIAAQPWKYYLLSIALFSNRNWYRAYRVSFLSTHERLDQLLPWLFSWDGTQPNQKNWLTRVLWRGRCGKMRAPIEPEVGGTCVPFPSNEFSYWSFH